MDQAVAAEMAAVPTYTEDELAAMIDTAVAEAVAATEDYTTATTTATEDGQVTAEEVQTIEVYVQAADAAVAAADEMIGAYYAYFGELAVETVDELSAIEEELDQIEDNIETMNDTLVLVEDTLNQGLELAEETIAQIENTAAAATDNLQAVQDQAQAWAGEVHTQVENRAQTLQTFQPTQLATDLPASLQQTQQFIDGVNSATGDKMLSRAELDQIAQLGVNAAASLDANGGPALQQLSGSVRSVTETLVRGNVGQAQLDLGGLQANLLAQGFGNNGGFEISNRPGADISAPELPARDGGSALPQPDISKPEISKPEISKPEISRPGRN
ncbi:MAG TPA: hypothetical protein PKE64_11835 [Anaerolineae bacterium]|nr:hypothetical protein [Anaerolineae bacterium]